MTTINGVHASPYRVAAVVRTITNTNTNNINAARTNSKPRSSSHERVVHNAPVTANDMASADGDSAITNYRQGDTIVQLSSGYGAHGKPVGVAIIRLSGPDAVKAVAALTRRTKPLQPRKATVVTLYRRTDNNTAIAAAAAAPSSQSWSSDILDAPVVALHFAAPASFTGEDVIELHVHGNRIIVQQVLRELCTIEHVRLAEAGEFTRRAFDSGKLDLTQVEGLADLLHAETEQQRKQALRQMDGQLGRLYEQWRTDLLGCLAHLEAVIDFAEDEADVGEEEIMKNGTYLHSLYASDSLLYLCEIVIPRITALRRTLHHHLSDGRRGELVRSGVAVAIVGAPNAGKSTLLNTLAKRDVAIVSPVAGTTRDVLECSLDLGGYPVVLADTAGLRITDDIVEKEGVRRARLRVDQADLKVALFDLSAVFREVADSKQNDSTTTSFTSSASTSSVPRASYLDLETSSIVDRDTMVIFTKMDRVLATGVAADAIEQRLWDMTGKDVFPNGPPAVACTISCETGMGVPQFMDKLQKQVALRLERSDSAPPTLTRERHRAHIQACIDALDEFEQFRAAGSLVRSAERLRQAMRALGRVVGRVDVDHLLDVIFNDFCLGK